MVGRQRAGREAVDSGWVFGWWKAKAKTAEEAQEAFETANMRQDFAYAGRSRGHIIEVGGEVRSGSGELVSSVGR